MSAPLPSQGRRLILNALEAARPRLEPRIWVSEERVARAGLLHLVGHLPYSAPLAMIRLPSRLAWQVRARTPEWDVRSRQLAHERRVRLKLERQLVAALPDMDYLHSLGLGR